VSLGLPTARVYGASATPVLPPMPTRAQVCGIRMSFQGLTVPVVEETGYPWITAGPLPWFEAALVCLGPRNRTLAYAAKHAAGDTHALICFSGGMPLYNEPAVSALPGARLRARYGGVCRACEGSPCRRVHSSRLLQRSAE
jgi:hypothetical protein